MAKRQRLCPEITDPELRAFLDMVPSIRRYNTDLALAQPLKGEALTVPLEGRELSVYLHRAPASGRPAVFEFHGGGFVLGNAEKDDQLCESLAKRLDANVIGVNYRLAPEHPYPAALDDVYDVIAYFEAHGAEYGLDSRRMAVLGFSGGATLATAAALRAVKEGRFRLRAQALHYPYLDATRMPSEKAHYPCDMDPAVMAAFTRLYSREEERALSAVSPVCAAEAELRGMPPALILPAEYDALKEEGLAYAEHLRSAGVPVYCKVMPDAHHGYIEDAGNEAVYSGGTAEDVKKTHSPYFREWAKAAMDLTASFLRQRFAEEEA